jgi:hypothetical protein
MQVESSRIVPHASSATTISMTRAISFGIIDGRPVFMDERDDSYFLLEQEFETEFLKQLADGDAAPSATPGLRAALAIEGDSGSVAFAHCELPRRSLIAETCARMRPRLADALSLAIILRRARQALERRTIETLLADLVEADDGSAGQVQLERLVGRARRFLAARPLVPVRANCLLDSLSLLSWLGSARCGAMLVFGVKLDPFAAHCWVQTGNLLLNDHVDNVKRFGPVRVLKCPAVTR